MRVLMICPYLYPALSYGGPAKVVYDLARELSRKHEVTIYTSDVWNNTRRISKKEKLLSTRIFKIYYFKNLINSIAYNQRIFTSFGYTLKYIINREKYDIVHLHDVFVLPNLLIGLTAKLFNKKYVYSPHGVLDPVRTKNKSLFKKLVYNYLARYVLQNAANLIATSDDEKKVLNNLGFKKVITVYNGIPIREITPTFKYKKFGNEIFTILYIGKIHELKGLKELVIALKNSKINYQFLVAGPDDGDLDNLKNTIRENNIKNVTFLGFVNDNEKAELFKLSDLFVHPSLSEGFSISILEAMSYKLPLLITNACNFPDVKKYNAGIIVNESNLIKELTNTFKNFDKDENSLKSMGENGYSLVVKKYSIKSMAEKALKIYES